MSVPATVTIELNVEWIPIIMHGLGTIPYRDALAPITSIRVQATEQIEAAQAVDPAQ